MLDLVAVSIAADIVPIVDENRVMAYHGLKRLNSNPNMGFAQSSEPVDSAEKKSPFQT